MDAWNVFWHISRRMSDGALSLLPNDILLDFTYIWISFSDYSNICRFIFKCKIILLNLQKSERVLSECLGIADFGLFLSEFLIISYVCAGIDCKQTQEVRSRDASEKDFGKNAFVGMKEVTREVAKRWLRVVCRTWKNDFLNPILEWLTERDLWVVHRWDVYGRFFLEILGISMHQHALHCVCAEWIVARLCRILWILWKSLKSLEFDGNLWNPWKS